MSEFDGAFDTYTRQQWIEFGRAMNDDAGSGPWSLEVADGGPVEPEEVHEVYAPLATWIGRKLASRSHSGPATLGITGSVAVGKSTTARMLQELLTLGPGRPTVSLLATDGFLYTNRELGERGILDRKGFPESYDHCALAETLEAVRSGGTDVTVPVYSHSDYDVLPGEGQRIGSPDVLVVEGLTVLQAAPEDQTGAPDIRSLLDLAVYLDAAEEQVADWHIQRLMGLRSGLGDEDGFLGWLSSLTEAEAHQVAVSSWTEINLVNLREHVAPTRDRADAIIEKGPRHQVAKILLRRSGDTDRSGADRLARTADQVHPVAHEL